MLNVLRCQLTYYGQAVPSTKAWFNITLCPRKPEGSLGWTAQDSHLDSYTDPELWVLVSLSKLIEQTVPIYTSLQKEPVFAWTHATLSSILLENNSSF